MQSSSSSLGRYVLIATIFASGMAFLEGTILNVALPRIQLELSATTADLLWIVNIYSLLLGALILVGGSLGDRYGRVRVFRAGLVIFTVGCILCGLAPTVATMIAARAVQGIGGALMIPGSLAIISACFRGDERGQAIGTWSSATTIATLAGPAIGGFMADAGLWRLSFFMLVPLALVSLWALRLVPESRDETNNAPLDFLGAGLITLSLGGIVFGATEIGREGLIGFQNVLNVGALLLGIGLFVAFVVVESRKEHPLLNLHLFRSRLFSGLNALTFFLYGALAFGTFMLPLNLQQFQGYSATESGLVFLPFSLILAFLSRPIGRWSDKNGARLPLVIGCVLVGVGFLLFAPDYPDGFANYWTSYFFAILVLGLGMACVVAPLTSSIMGSVSANNTGLASGINNAVSRTAGVLAIAILGGVALVMFTLTLQGTLTNSELLPETTAQILAQPASFVPSEQVLQLAGEQEASVTSAYQASFQSAYHIAMVVSAVLAWVSAVLAALTTGRRQTKEG
jgi:EmrB/QacA subfamily drug resistance transporter